MHKEVIFREYDIRGVYNEHFDDQFAYYLGKALVTYIHRKTGNKKPRISIGIDARKSGVLLRQSMAKGIKESGGTAVVIGLVTSPVTYYTTFDGPSIDGAIMITGSHNPPEYNGFKVCSGKQTLFGEEIQVLKTIINDGDYLTGSGSEEEINVFDQYVEKYKKEFGKMKPIKVVLDCGNGAAGSIAKRLYDAVGLQPLVLFEKPDGTFPNHHPDPTVEKNLVDLKRAVKEQGAIVGIGFDGDADRIGIVDHNGTMILGDELMVIISRSVLAKNKGAKIIGDVKCSDRLYADIKNHGGEPIMWKTGHSLIKEKIKIEKAPFGGEMSGHVFFADRNYGYDDALYAGLRLCEIISETGKNIQQLLEGLPPSFNTPELRIDTTEEKKVLIVEKLKEKFSISSPEYSTNLLDGIRVSYKDGWALARASNTQPVLVLRYESNTEVGLKRIQDSFESVVNKYL